MLVFKLYSPSMLSNRGLSFEFQVWATESLSACDGVRCIAKWKKRAMANVIKAHHSRYNSISKWYLKRRALQLRDARVGVGVARSRGNEPWIGVGDGVDQTTSILTPERFCSNLWYNLPLQWGICMQFFKIFADIIFHFCNYTHINRERGGPELHRRNHRGLTLPCPASTPKTPENGTKSANCSI